MAKWDSDGHCAPDPSVNPIDLMVSETAELRALCELSTRKARRLPVKGGKGRAKGAVMRAKRPG